MKRVSFKSLLILIGFASIVAVFLVPSRPSAAKAEAAFGNVRSIDQAPVSLRTRLESLKAARGAGAVRIARFDRKAVDAATVGKTITFDLGASISVKARAVAADTVDGRLIWRGEVSKASPSLPPGIATLVIKGDDVTGSIRTEDGRMLRLRSLGGGETAVVELNYKTLPPDHPPSATVKPTASKSLVAPSSAPAAGSSSKQKSVTSVPTSALKPSVQFPVVPTRHGIVDTGVGDSIADRTEWARAAFSIDVYVLYTARAESSAGDIQSLIALAVAETNDSFLYSNIAANLRLVGTMGVLPYNERGRSYDTMIEQLKGKTDGEIDIIHQRRDALKADIVVMLVDNDDYCGMAAEIAASPETAFAVVHYDCATAYFSFAHEIGHLVGARHNEMDDFTFEPYRFGHGFRHQAAEGEDESKGFRTIMSYRCSDDRCETRLPYWSSPLLIWNSEPLGTNERADNRRVWNLRAAEVSRFR